eukprot:scaffold247_cov172-Ochromonas_danica.AAC.17
MPRCMRLPGKTRASPGRSRMRSPRLSLSIQISVPPQPLSRGFKEMRTVYAVIVMPLLGGTANGCEDHVMCAKRRLAAHHGGELREDGLQDRG